MFFYALIASLWASDLDYVTIEKGQTAPFSGKLMSNSALAQIIETHESEILRLDLEKEYELQKQADEFQLKYELYETRCEANIEMYQQMIDVRDKELNMQSKKDWIQQFSFFGGFILGTAVAVGITYSVNQN